MKIMPLPLHGHIFILSTGSSKQAKHAMTYTHLGQDVSWTASLRLHICEHPKTGGGDSFFAYNSKNFGIRENSFYLFES